MEFLPEKHTKSYFTTARVIHDEIEHDWLWVNTSARWQFDTEDEAQSHANQSNENGISTGLDIEQFPYFVVRVTQTSLVEAVA